MKCVKTYNIDINFTFSFNFANSVHLVSSAESRIRLRKVKDSVKTCSYMKEDTLLSRPEKPVWSTERHSIILGDEISLVNDLGQTVCTWPRSVFNPISDLTNFRFYIDEYKEIIYPYVDNKESGFVEIKASFKNCTFDEQVKLASLEFPKCEKDKSKGRSRRNKKKKLNS